MNLTRLNYQITKKSENHSITQSPQAHHLEIIQNDNTIYFFVKSTDKVTNNLESDLASIKPFRSSPPEVFLGKGVLKICNKFTEEHPCRSVISIKLLCNFIEITFRHGFSPVNLLFIVRTPFPKNTS